MSDFSGSCLHVLRLLLCLGLLCGNRSLCSNLPKSQKTPRAGSCVCFYFSFVSSDITFHMSPAQNGLPSCCCSALFRAVCFCAFLSLPCFVDSLTNCQCVSHFLPLIVSAVHRERYVRLGLWSVSHLPVLTSNVCSSLHEMQQAG